jgi:hypothetical protein
MLFQESNRCYTENHMKHKVQNPELVTVVYKVTNGF